MGWLRLITAGLEAAAAYFTWRTNSLIYDEIDKAERKLDELEEQLERLRRTGISADAVAGDGVLERIQRQAAYLSTLYATADKRTGDTNP